MFDQKTQPAGGKCRMTVYALVILPAVALGVWAMMMDGVSPVLWGQQAAAFAVFAALGLLRGRGKRIPASVCAAAFLFVMAASFFFPGAGGARRWLDLGVFNVNAAMLVLPALIALIDDMECPYPALLGAAVILALQPDASQLTALAAAAIPLVWGGRKNPVLPAVCLLALAACMAWGFGVPVDLEPAAYCEGVLGMLKVRSFLLMVLGAAALALIPAYFLYGGFVTKQPRMLRLAAYYAVMMLFGVSGEYPVPFMGFGLSPIAGYFLAYLFMTQEETARG